MPDPITDPPPPEVPRRTRLWIQGLGLTSVLVAIYLFLFPLPVLAADAVGFSLRDQTKAGEAVTDPIVYLAERLPPYRAYLMGSRQLLEYLYLAT